MNGFGRRRFLVQAGMLGATALLSQDAFAAAAGRAPRRVIIDTDPGVDDALALLLALRAPELKVEALTVVPGNVPLETTLSNALRMAELANRADVPVAAGAKLPLRRLPPNSAYAHGDNGLGGVVLPEPRLRPVSEPAPDLIRRLVRASPGEISLIALGPLTNVAMALQADAQLASMVRSLTVMGGSLSGGNITPAAEFNFYVDPEAAQAVFRSGMPITMVGLDVTRQAELTEPYIRRLEAARDAGGRVSGQIMRATQALVRRTGANGGRVLAHDSMAVSSFIDPSLIRVEDVHVEVETSGELTAGASLGYRRSPMRRAAAIQGMAYAGDLGAFQPNAKVAVGVDSERFLEFMVGRLIGA